jgi:hypothetical protein
MHVSGAKFVAADQIPVAAAETAAGTAATASRLAARTRSACGFSPVDSETLPVHPSITSSCVFPAGKLRTAGIYLHLFGLEEAHHLGRIVCSDLVPRQILYSFLFSVTKYSTMRTATFQDIRFSDPQLSTGKAGGTLRENNAMSS